MAEENSVCWEHEGIVGELHGRQCLCVHHQLERFDPITCRRGDAGGGGGRGRPYSEASRDQGGGNGKRTDLAHLGSPRLLELAVWCAAAQIIAMHKLVYYTLVESYGKEALRNVAANRLSQWQSTGKRRL